MRSISLFIMCLSLFMSFSLFANDKILFCKVEERKIDPCLVGKWVVDKEGYKDVFEQLSRGLSRVESITGNVFLNFEASGVGRIDYDQFFLSAYSKPFFKAYYSYNGQSEFNYSVDSNNRDACSEVIHSGVEVKAWMMIQDDRIDLDHVEAPISQSGEFKYSCSKTELTYEVKVGIDTIFWKFYRQ